MSFKQIESILSILSKQEIYDVLVFFQNEDCYLQDLLDGDTLEEFLSVLVHYDIVWIASDDRVLLTTIGEQFMQSLASTVDFTQKASKIKKTYGYKKHKQ